jgi:hypothetical protein
MLIFSFNAFLKFLYFSHCYYSVYQCYATVLPTAQPTLTMAREGTSQNFALRKGGTKQYTATKKCGSIRKPLSCMNYNELMLWRPLSKSRGW